ncbi:MAG: alpha-ketoglutarate-dependent dioxygenase AlkB [Planctomycetes bacterium]|nr:alpha-ketoglutarate-dependent dioxygenase AlkB [Planctomycetota bacterium]
MPAFLSRSEADRLLALLLHEPASTTRQSPVAVAASDSGKISKRTRSARRDVSDAIAWKQEHGRFGRPFPRLTALYGDPGVCYTYSGTKYDCLPWTPELALIRRRVEEAAKAPMNSVLLNRYRDGQDSMGFHADDEPELGKNPILPSISLGAERRFVLRHTRSGRRLEYVLGHGSLLIMAGTLQHFWQHALPKTKDEVGERVNLTFRRIHS